MRFITARTHGLFDYIAGFIILHFSWALDIEGMGPAVYLPVIIGGMMIILALFTNFQLGSSRYISFNTHLLIDLLIGAFFAISPWLFNYSDVSYFPHLFSGIAIFLVAAFTNPETATAVRIPKEPPETPHEERHHQS